MEETMRDMMEEIERQEAEVFRLRYIYYHIQNWVHSGRIRDMRTLDKVRAYCECYYPKLDLPQCYEKAIKDIRIERERV